MNKQNVNIVNNKTLFNILDEIKLNLNFNIFNYKSTDDLNNTNLKNSLFVIKPINEKKIQSMNLDKKYFYILENLPIELIELIENINVRLIKLKYIDQANLSIKEYKLNLNSRIILKDNKELKLTEKEIDIILFLKEKKKPQKIDILQSQVWGYSLDLETHTVETHIYRLRKKIKEIFNDDKFILSLESGYLI